MSQSDPKDNLSSVAEGDHPVLETVFAINIDALERSGLDQDTYLLVRLAALVALNAPPASYAVTLGASVGSSVTAEDAQAVLVAIAPLVGTPRIVAAAGNLLRAVGGMEALSDSEPE